MNNHDYNKLGFLHYENFFSDSELAALEKILNLFHENWLAENKENYETGLINSHSITSGRWIGQSGRLELFNFIFQDKIRNVVKSIFQAKAVLLNTQLFFDPFNGEQKNYWHRDVQYTGLTVEQQKEAILNRNIVHFRIPLKPESGIELIPGTHRDWDLEEEFETRLSLNGRKPNDKLERGKEVGLNRGDLLIFSANMIHRGLYGNNRFSFDIIFCDDTP